MRFDFALPVFYNDSDIEWNDGLARRLIDRGARVAFLTHTRFGERELKKLHPHVFYVYDGFDPDRRPSSDEMRALEKKYDFGSFYDFVYPEQMMPGAQRKEMLIRRAVHDFRFIEDFTTKNDVKMFFNNLGPEILRRCMFRLRDKGGPENMVLDFAPIPGRVALTTQEAAWDELPDELPEITPEQREAMVAYVQKATTAKKSFAAPGSLTLKPHNFLNAFRYTKRALSERLDVSMPELYALRVQSLVRVRAAQRLYETPPQGERYYFFPLHLADDSAVTIRAPQFQRQDEIVQYVAERVLPAGTKLYVKPHIAALHAYSHSMLAKIAKIPNVRLVDARIISHQLIKNAEAMIVINSTVGFESMLYGKPVVCLGPIFYRRRGLTTDVDQLADLPRAVAHAVANPPDMERFYRFLHACHEATYPGHTETVTQENMDLIGASLLQKAEKLGLGVGSSATASSAPRAGAVFA